MSISDSSIAYYWTSMSISGGPTAYYWTSGSIIELQKFLAGGRGRRGTAAAARAGRGLIRRIKLSISYL